MMQIGLNHFLILSAILFSIGLYGTLAKKNAVAVIMGIELMLNAVNINLVAFSKYITPGDLTGQIFAIFVVVIAAAEVTVGLALVISIYRDRLSVNVEDFDWLKW
jgi:NAD(P)H-quinone oxidoreductase subunit 4L